jgi:hypothetical protein
MAPSLSVVACAIVEQPLRDCARIALARAQSRARMSTAHERHPPLGVAIGSESR